MPRDPEGGDRRIEESKESGCRWREIDDPDEVELGDRIGGGGVGVVYQGCYRGEAVGIKALFDPRVDDGLKKEFMDELLIMSRLQHPNIVSVIGACVQSAHMFFVMELCVESLFDLLHSPRGPQLSLREQLQMALDTARAMEYLHSHRPSIIHRDLKTHNLLLAPDGSVKLCDFGLVRAKNTTAGTPSYMAPELLEGRPFNRSVDVYAFGIVLHEIMTCEVFLAGYDAGDIRRSVLGGERPRPPTVDCPEELQSLMQRCWSARTTERPDFSTVVEELEDVMRSLPEKSSLDVLEDDQGDALDSLMSFAGDRRK